jgi:hypothetical protein
LSMRITELTYGSLLSYSPHGRGTTEDLSKSYRTSIKNDEPIKKAGIDIPMSRYIAEYVLKQIQTLPFKSLFESNPILVPIRSSSLKQPNSLWMPYRICMELHHVGLGRDVKPIIKRVYALPKSATSGSRSTAQQHYDSQSVEGLVQNPDSFLLIDDVITTGATMIGSANLLANSYPDSRIEGFAALRTVSDPDEFQGIYDSVLGQITLYPSGKTHRDP